MDKKSFFIQTEIQQLKNKNQPQKIPLPILHMKNKFVQQ